MVLAASQMQDLIHEFQARICESQGVPREGGVQTPSFAAHMTDVLASIEKACVEAGSLEAGSLDGCEEVEKRNVLLLYYHMHQTKYPELGKTCVPNLTAHTRTRPHAL